MIFATVGTQLPFPRLVDWLDETASRLSLRAFAQTADPSAEPKHIEARPFLDPSEHDRKIRQCSAIVAHAGIGTVLAAKRARKPLIIIPRSARLGEHRNEHQLATARFLERSPGIYVAWSTEQLDSLLRRHALESPIDDLGPQAERLVNALARQLRDWREGRA